MDDSHATSQMDPVTTETQPPAQKAKRSRSFIWIILVVLLLSGGAWLAYKFIKPSSGGPRINPLNLVPPDAFFILETEEPYSVWSKLAETQIWKTLSKDEEWKEYGTILEEIESRLSSFNSILDVVMIDRSTFPVTCIIGGAMITCSFLIWRVWGCLEAG